MRKLIFLALLAGALGIVPSALADTQELLVTPYTTTVGAKADTESGSGLLAILLTKRKARAGRR